MYKVLKLVTGENVLADVYYFSELDLFDTLNEYFKNYNVNENSLILLDPALLIVSSSDKNNEPKTLLYYYLMFSDDSVVIIQQDKIVTISNPEENILKAYNDFMFKNQSKTKNDYDSGIKKIETGNLDKITNEEKLAILKNKNKNNAQ